MTSSRRALLAAALVTATTLAPGAARALTSPEDLASARALVKQGREARRANDLLGALEKFTAAYALAQTAVTGIELARSEEAVGQLVEARETCLAIARMPVEPDETHLSTDARAEAKELADKLAPRIPSIVVRVAGVAPGDGTDVTVDGAHVPPEALGETRMVDPGTHAVVASRAGDTESAQVTVGEGETREVNLTMKPAAPPPPKPATPPPPPPKVVRLPPPPPPPPDTPSRVPVYIGFGVAGAGAIVGTITGLMAFSMKSTLEAECPKAMRCYTPQAHSDLDKATTLGDVSTIAFGAAIVGAVVAVYTLLHSASSSSPSASAHVAPVVGVGPFGVHASF